MRFEWDEDKRQANLRRHRIDFLDAEMVFGGPTVTFEDTRHDYGERRFVTFGTLQGRVVAIVHADSEDVIRIISMRKATRHEERGYFAQIQD